MKCLALSLATFILLSCAPQFACAADRGKSPAKSEYLLHLPGIAGERNLDRRFVEGLRDGGYTGTIEIIDWPGKDPGLSALLARQRNEQQADKLANTLRDLAKDDPEQTIRVVCHSGGAGIAVWALERLPAEVKIETLVFVAPALSQRYDLSKALTHVRGKAYAFTSENDVLVLGAGTSLFGTIDGVKEQAAGMKGFTQPDRAADAKQYRKLVQLPYRNEWMEFGNIGDHIGPMDEVFAANVISPLLQDRDTPTTHPTKPAAPKPAAHPDRAGAAARSSPPTPAASHP